MRGTAGFTKHTYIESLFFIGHQYKLKFSKINDCKRKLTKDEGKSVGGSEKEGKEKKG